jgi:uncharacterized protein YbaA (DUF1428 family)
MSSSHTRGLGINGFDSRVSQLPRGDHGHGEDRIDHQLHRGLRGHLPASGAGENVEAYREQATTFGKVAKEHGALGYREFLGDDLDEKLKVQDGELLTAAVAEFESRAHRDEVMDKVMKDPRVTELVEGGQVADMSQMRYGGFKTFVTP